MRHLTVEAVSDFLLRNDRARVLDVRLSRERDDGHLHEDYHVPWVMPDGRPNPDFLYEVLRRLSREDCVLVMCSNGQRSWQAAARLETAGFNHLYNVLGGYGDLCHEARAVDPTGAENALLPSRRA